MPTEPTRKSRLTTEGVGRAPNRAMLRAVGFLDGDFDKPMIGVASLFSEITPCNAHLDRLARKGCEGIRAAGGVGQIFGAPTASDGIMMGHQGMRYSLVSREVIADSIEVVAGATTEHVDADGAELRERVTGQVRLGQDHETGQAAGRGEPVPDRRSDRRQAEHGNQAIEHRLETSRITQECGVAPARVDDPLGAAGQRRTGRDGIDDGAVLRRNGHARVGGDYMAARSSLLPGYALASRKAHVPGTRHTVAR